MTIGNLTTGTGDVTFYASSEGMQIFQDLKHKSSVTYAEHKRHMKKPLVELTGKNADEVSFDMELSVLLGASPKKTFDSLQNMMNKGEVGVLVLGTSLIGKNWVVTDVSRTFGHLYKDGRMISCKVTVTLKEYN